MLLQTVTNLNIKRDISIILTEDSYIIQEVSRSYVLFRGGWGEKSEGRLIR